jgi:hypothetical protein
MGEFVVLVLSRGFAEDGLVLSAARGAAPNRVFVPGRGEFDCSLPHNRRERRGRNGGWAGALRVPARGRDAIRAPLLPAPILWPPPAPGAGLGPPRADLDRDWCDLELSSFESNSVADGDPFFDSPDLSFC